MAMSVAKVGRSDNDANEIVDTIMGIIEADDDGPKTPRGKRKRLNGAEQFYAGYHAEYVDKLEENKRVSRVQNHNAAYPKLHSELDKRRSMCEVRTIYHPKLIIEIARPDCDPTCKACTKLAVFHELKRQNLKHKCPKAENRSCRGRDRARGSRDRIPRDRTPRDKKLCAIRSRISKHKSHSRRTTPTASKTVIAAYKQCTESKSSQHKFTTVVQDENIETSIEDTQLIEPSIPTAPQSDTQCTDSNSQMNFMKRYLENRESNISQNGSHPGSRQPSFISNYSSNLSLSHEPMVQR